MRRRKLAPRRQPVVRILIPVRRDILLVLLPMLLVFGSRFVSVYVGDAVAAVTAVRGLGGSEVFVVVVRGGAGLGAAHCC